MLTNHSENLEVHRKKLCSIVFYIEEFKLDPDTLTVFIVIWKSILNMVNVFSDQDEDATTAHDSILAERFKSFREDFTRWNIWTQTKQLRSARLSTFLKLSQLMHIILSFF